MIHCTKCHKQYIGEMKQRPNDRFNKHQRFTDSPSPQSPSAHFVSSLDHSASHISLVPIEKIFSPLNSLRKTRQDFYITHLANTLEPNSLNK